MRITFLHPDLGLGGAERLVVDAAVELQMRGHEVRICTTQHDPQRSFAETHDGTLAVRVGEPARRLPMLGGNARALQAIHAMRAMALATARRDADSDIYFCDLIAHAIPALRRRTRAKIVYFCHFPDKFLAPQRAGSLYRLYRNVLDHLEERGIAAADKILVNSHFTAERLRAAFPRLAARPTEVVYPGISDPVRTAPMTKPSTKSPWTVLTLNRFDPTKRHDRAIDAFAELRNLVTPAQFACLRLVVAGSCDRRLPEQVDTVARLRRRAERLGLNGQVQFRLSISDDERWRLLTTSRCLVYTPENEHFGIGPVEAMHVGLPVVAADSGGLRETVVSGETGLLCPPTGEGFARAVATIIADPEQAARMGAAGRSRVARHFSRTRFGAQLDSIVRSL